MVDKYRRQDFFVVGSEAFVTLFQRPNEKSLIDCSYFEEDITVTKAESYITVLQAAVDLGKHWDLELIGLERL